MSYDLTKTDKELLSAWVGANTAASGHPLDWNRWFDFVNNHSNEVGNVVSESEVREFLHDKEKYLKGGVSYLFAKIIDKHITATVHILNFLEHTKR
jgi:hypothetical protein